MDYTYNLNGGRTGATYKQSGETVSQSSWLYDVANHTTRITHRTAQDAAFADYQLTWDEGSNITRIISNDGQADYAYDLLGQLVGADYDFMADESYGYDANGNDENYTIGDDNVLVSDGFSTYEHDAEGNRISKTNAAGTERELYTWDYRNRLTQVALQEYDTTISAWVTVQVVEYAYDYQNQLITRTVGTTTETFVYENNQAILQFSGSTLTDINLWGANVDELVAVEKPVTGIIYWAYSDHLNSIRDVCTYDTATHTLTLENHLVYNAFGKITSSLNASNVAIDPILRNAYTGKYLDPVTKLQTNLHRWYDPITRRWMSEDPISFDGGDTNLYRYVGNRVLIFFDINGLEKILLVHATPPDNFSSIISEGLKNGLDGTRWFSEPKIAGAGASNKATIHLVYEFDAKAINDVPCCVEKEAKNFARKKLRGVSGVEYNTKYGRLIGDYIADWVKKQSPGIYRRKINHRLGEGYQYIISDDITWKNGKPKLIQIKGKGLPTVINDLKKQEIPALRKLASKKWGNRVVFAGKIASRGICLIGAGESVYEVYSSENKLKEATKQVGGWAGMWGGAKIGAWAGAQMGAEIALITGQFGPQALVPEEIATIPIASGIGSIIGGIGGGIGGFFVGYKTSQVTYEWVFEKGLNEQ